MPSSIRVFLIGAVLFSAGHLAAPGTVQAEPEPVPAWTGEPSAEPASAVPLEVAGSATLTQQPATADVEVDLWAEFFAATGPGTPGKAVPVAPSPAPLRAAALAKPTSTYQIQQNDHVQRFLEQFQTGYRRAVVERWLTRSGRYLPMILDVLRQKGLP